MKVDKDQNKVNKKQQESKKINKSSAEQIINQALHFHFEGNISEAAKYYQYCIKQGLNDCRVFSNYGLILQNIGKLKDAENSYRKAIEINPNFANAHCNIGNVLRDLGKLKDAELFTRKAIELNPKFANAYSNLGIILQDLNKLKDAENSYRKAIEINPDFVEAHFNMGNLLRDIGKLQNAELSLRKAIELNPNFANAYSNLGNVLIDLEKMQEAELSYRKAIEINPDFTEAHYNLGNILKDLDNLKEAENSYRKAIELNPKFANAYSNLGIILQDLNKLKDAENSYRKAIEINPDFVEAHFNMGNLLRDIGKLQNAELSLRKAIELNPNFANAYSNLGNVLIDLEKMQEAELSYRKAIEINPDFAEAYYNLFRLYEETNNLKKLKESLNEFQKTDSIENEILLFRSRLSFRNNEQKTAKQLIDKISSKWIEKCNGNQLSIFWNYKGFIEDKIGNFDFAYSCFQKSQKIPSFEKFSKDSFLDFINSYTDSITKKKKKFNNFNDEIEDLNLVFLIGFPRSGTTLLDTILRSHKKIEVIEEKPLISTIEVFMKEKFNIKIHSLYDLSIDNIIILRKKYFQLLTKYSKRKANLIIDKLPLNTVSIPLINLLFPNAKIIFTHRHPYDTVLSCFQQTFAANNAMKNLISLKSSSIMYDQVMSAWDLYQKNLTFDFITSKYENLIEDFHNHTFKIIDFLGVGWDENVRNYKKTALERGKINTPSSSQVVQPLYRSSIDKWKNYEKYFEDCHQYLEKWITYFEY